MGIILFQWLRNWYPDSHWSLDRLTRTSDRMVWRGVWIVLAESHFDCQLMQLQTVWIWIPSSLTKLALRKCCFSCGNVKCRLNYWHVFHIFWSSSFDDPSFVMSKDTNTPIIHCPKKEFYLNKPLHQSPPISKELEQIALWLYSLPSARDQHHIDYSTHAIVSSQMVCC